MEKHILLCVAGMTPQIITETLYALTQERGERIDEIRVITTLDGRDKIMHGKGVPEESLLDPSAGQFYNFCRDFQIDPRSIKCAALGGLRLVDQQDGRGEFFAIRDQRMISNVSRMDCFLGSHGCLLPLLEGRAELRGVLTA